MLQTTEGETSTVKKHTLKQGRLRDQEEAGKSQINIKSKASHKSGTSPSSRASSPVRPGLDCLDSCVKGLRSESALHRLEIGLQDIKKNNYDDIGTTLSFLSRNSYKPAFEEYMKAVPRVPELQEALDSTLRHAVYVADAESASLLLSHGANPLSQTDFPVAADFVRLCKNESAEYEEIHELIEKHTRTL